LYQTSFSGVTCLFPAYSRTCSFFPPLPSFNKSFSKGPPTLPRSSSLLIFYLHPSFFSCPRNASFQCLILRDRESVVTYQFFKSILVLRPSSSSFPRRALPSLFPSLCKSRASPYVCGVFLFSRDSPDFFFPSVSLAAFSVHSPWAQLGVQLFEHGRCPPPQQQDIVP